MITLVIVLFVICMAPLLSFGQTMIPNWINDDYRTINYPIDMWYSGFAMDKMSADEQLISLMQRVENSARNRLVEQIQISIESSSILVKSSHSTSGKAASGWMTMDYRQDIQTTTNASAVGVEVKSYFDSNNNIAYAFAYVNRTKLATYYMSQEEAVFKEVESELNIIDDLVKTGQKIAALHRCEQSKANLHKAKDYRHLISIIADSETAYSNSYTILSELVEKLLFSLQQSTKVFVSCVWCCEEYPQYGYISEIVKENIETLLSSNDCAVVSDSSAADYVLDLTLSTTQRSDGRDEYAIISYYANLVGGLVNAHTGKQIVNISLIQDPRIYSAGKNDAEAVSKAFRSQPLSRVLHEIIIPRLQK